VKLQSAQSPLSAATIANFPSSFSTRHTVRGDAPRATIAIMTSATRSSQRQKPVVIVWIDFNALGCRAQSFVSCSSRQDRTIQIAHPFSELKATLTVALPS
jgi:hypothetical protein